MSESAPYVRGHSHTPSYNSAETGGIVGSSSTSTLPLDTDPRPLNRTPPHSPPSGFRASTRLGSSPRPDGVRIPSGKHGGRAGGGSFNVRRLGQAIASRIVRAARRGNLPFLIVFMSCLVFFFSALAGIGYVDPEANSVGIDAAAAPAAFMPGVPVFDPNSDSEIAKRQRVEERRQLEREWQKQKRPKDGAWMQRQRDDKAVRRVPVKEPEAVPMERFSPGTTDDEDVVKREVDDQGAQWAGSAVLGENDLGLAGNVEGPGDSAEEETRPKEILSSEDGVGDDQLEQEQEESAAEREMLQNLESNEEIK